MGRTCGDCGASPGEAHVPGCDVEICILCGRQAIGCPCVYELSGIVYDSMEATHPDIYSNGPTEEMDVVYEKAVQEAGGPVLWSGEWPGKAECRELGLLEFPSLPGKWVPCDGAHPGASEDLNRLHMVTVWDKVRRRRMALS